MSAHVLLVEDDPVLSQTLVAELSVQGHNVTLARSCADAVALLNHHPRGIDLVLLDLGLPDGDGSLVLRHARSKGHTPVVIISARQDDGAKVTLLDDGADDYLVKPFSLSELQARVRALLRRGAGVAAPTLHYGELTFDTVDRVASVSGQPLPLSMHEAGVLEVLLRRFGRVVSKEQLVEQLYSYDKEVSHNAIEVYIHRVRKKLTGAGVEVRTHYGRGYVIDHAV